MEKKQICRLCFNVVGCEFSEINDIIGEMLKVLLLDMDWSIIKNRAICKTCTTIIKRSFYFKSVYVHTEKFIASFAVNKKETKFKLEDMVYNKKGAEMTMEENFRCRFCMNQITKNNLFSIEVLMEDTLYKKMLPKCMPEIDFSIVNIPIICTPCKENLDCYIMFVRNFLDTENKIHVYNQNIGSNQIKSTDLLHFQFNGTFTRPNKGNVAMSEEPERVCSFELLKTEEILDIEDEEVLLKEDPQNKVHLKSNMLIHKDASDVVQMYKCKLCTYVTQYKRSLDAHIFTHKNESGMYKCTHCSYETKWRHRIINHAITHEDISEVQMYECELCSYMTRHKRTLKQHLLIHKDPSEVKMYKCPLCPYESKRKAQLTSHSINHKDASELEMYGCLLCDRQFKRKQERKRHMLSHRYCSELKMYKCPACNFQTKYGNDLSKHMFTHREDGVSEISVYECTSHSINTRNRFYRNGHMITYKGEQKLQIYKCAVCTFETKYKRGLRRHMLIHPQSGASETAAYKCPTCSFQTKHKYYIKQHIMLIHKEGSELETFKCAVCPFETKYKSKLRRHMLSYRHKKALEVKK